MMLVSTIILIRKTKTFIDQNNRPLDSKHFCQQENTLVISLAEKLRI